MLLPYSDCFKKIKINYQRAGLFPVNPSNLKSSDWLETADLPKNPRCFWTCKQADIASKQHSFFHRRCYVKAVAGRLQLQQKLAGSGL